MEIGERITISKFEFKRAIVAALSICFAVGFVVGLLLSLTGKL